MPASLWNSFRSCVAVRYLGRCAFGNILTYRRMTDWLQHYEGMKEDKMSKYDPLWKYVSAAAFWKRCMRNFLCPRRKSHEQKMCCQSRNNTQDTAITVAALLLGFFTRILCRRTGSAPLSDAMARLVYFCNAYREKALWYRKKAYGTADDGRAEAGICGGRLLLRIPFSVIRISSVLIRSRATGWVLPLPRWMIRSCLIYCLQQDNCALYEIVKNLLLCYTQNQ